MGTRHGEKLGHRTPGALPGASAAAEMARSALVIAGAVATLVPFWWMVVTALQSPAGAFAQPPQWVPRPPHWENFWKATSVVPFWRGVGNTLLLTVVPLVAGLLASAL